VIKDTTRVEPEFESLTDDDTEAKSIVTTTDVSAHSKLAWCHWRQTQLYLT